MEWMILPLKRYAQFRGRSRRKEFWMWVLLILIVSIILSVIDAALGLGGRAGGGFQSTPDGSFRTSAGFNGGVLTSIFSLAVLVPNLAVQVRRLHDTNRSGWWLLVPFLLYAAGVGLILTSLFSASAGLGLVGGLLLAAGGIGFIVLLVFSCLEGTRGPNRYGPDPKDPAGDLDAVFR